MKYNAKPRGKTGSIHGIGFTDPVIITEFNHKMIVGAVRQVQRSVSELFFFHRFGMYRMD